MKTRVAAAVLLALLLAVPAMAQEKPMTFGVKGGVNIANLVFDPEPEEGMDNLMGMGLGGTMSYMISPGFSIDTDLLYLQKGAKETVTVDGCDLTSKVKLSYVSLIPMLRYTLQAQGFAPYFLIGPEVGFLMSAKVKGEGDCEGVEGSAEVDIKDQTKSVDFGLNFGAGVQIPAGNMALFFEARYALGLSNIEDTSDEEEGTLAEDEEDTSTKTKGIYLFAGVRF